MANAKRRDAVKERFWRGVFARWRQSGLGVRGFCVRENLSEASFYAWRRELRLREKEASRQELVHLPRPGPLFVPVRVEARAGVEGQAGSEQIRILLADGGEVRVGSGFDSKALKRVLTVLQELRTASVEGASC